jgi:hypothetical protein
MIDERLVERAGEAMAREIERQTRGRVDVWDRYAGTGPAFPAPHPVLIGKLKSTGGGMVDVTIRLDDLARVALQVFE